MRRLIAIALITAIVGATAFALIAFRLTATPEPDRTMADCAVWADTQYPNLPANTYPDRCYDPATNTVHYVP